ncbi:MAG: DUF5050 domain-containing protein [Lachnospiraceae bacterium]|nr:DUF5050 domain-containing protein [Lachnospiraceae bacterium]
MGRTGKRILAAGIALGLIILVAVLRLAGKSAAAIPKNPPGTTGSSAGNLYNGGSFCESDGIVFFSNPYDGGSIYAMNPDQSGIRKVVTADASLINCAGGYLYYFSASSAGQSGLGYVRDGRGIYRVDSAGKRNILLKQITTDTLLLYGNELLYTNFTEDEKKQSAVVTLSSISIDGETERPLLSEHPKLGCVVGTEVWYAGMDGDHHLHALDPLSISKREVTSLNMYEPDEDNGLVYFLDMDDDMHLKVWSSSDNSVRIISEERIETFNRYGDTIYYQTIDESGANNYAFKRIRTDGSGEEVIYEGVVRDIQVTSQYVYFRDYKADLPIYQLAPGASSIGVFSGAADAVAAP